MKALLWFAALIVALLLIWFIPERGIERPEGVRPLGYQEESIPRGAQGDLVEPKLVDNLDRSQGRDSSEPSHDVDGQELLPLYRPSRNAGGYGVKVSGVVYNSLGDGAGGVTVFAQENKVGTPPQRQGSRRVKSDPDGSYSLFLEPGQWRIGAIADNEMLSTSCLCAQSQFVGVHGDRFIVDLHVGTGGAVRGRLMFPRNADHVFGIELFQAFAGGALMGSGYSYGHPEIRGSHDSTDNFEPAIFAEVPAGDYRLVVYYDMRKRFVYEVPVSIVSEDAILGDVVLSFDMFRDLGE